MTRDVERRLRGDLKLRGDVTVRLVVLDFHLRRIVDESITGSGSGVRGI